MAVLFFQLDCFQRRRLIGNKGDTPEEVMEFDWPSYENRCGKYNQQENLWFIKDRPLQAGVNL